MWVVLCVSRFIQITHLYNIAAVPSATLIGQVLYYSGTAWSPDTGWLVFDIRKSLEVIPWPRVEKGSVYTWYCRIIMAWWNRHNSAEIDCYWLGATIILSLVLVDRTHPSLWVIEAQISPANCNRYCPFESKKSGLRNQSFHWRWKTLNFFLDSSRFTSVDFSFVTETHNFGQVS